ncbi:hypothetical protein [Desulfotomaculum nigrificans]|uniref:hypothetical protein n=1 Tax=Desulfotomaculum nigrificans TaxID=1565 RepID=UPI00030134FE|nr:hypothetical protein [Desulfotomaculum nigrificans]
MEFSAIPGHGVKGTLNGRPVLPGTRKLMQENNMAVGIPVAALGLLNPVIAEAAMALSSVSVVSNALRLKKFRPQPTV